MTEDISKIISNLQNFLGLQRLAADKKAVLLKRITIGSMRKQALKTCDDKRYFYTKSFFRKGQVNDWMNHATTKQQKVEWTAWVMDGMSSSGIQLPRGNA